MDLYVGRGAYHKILDRSLQRTVLGILTQEVHLAEALMDSYPFLRLVQGDVYP